MRTTINLDDHQHVQVPAIAGNLDPGARQVDLDQTFDLSGFDRLLLAGLQILIVPAQAGIQGNDARPPKSVTDQSGHMADNSNGRRPGPGAYPPYRAHKRQKYNAQRS